MLLMAGLHTPVMPLSEVVGKAAITAPSQNGPTGVKVGTVFGVIVIAIDAVVTHVPPDGVKVYVPEAVLLTGIGDHTPEIPSLDVVGNAGIVAPLQ